MPIDYNFENTPSFRDVTRTSLLLLRQPIVRSLARLRRLRQGQAVPEGAARPPRTNFRRSPLTGSLY